MDPNHPFPQFPTIKTEPEERSNSPWSRPLTQSPFAQQQAHQQLNNNPFFRAPSLPHQPIPLSFNFHNHLQQALRHEFGGLASRTPTPFPTFPTFPTNTPNPQLARERQESLAQTPQPYRIEHLLQNNNPSTQQTPQPQPAEPISFRSREIFENKSVESMEQMISKATELLDALHSTISSCADAGQGRLDVTVLLQQIEAIRSKAKVPKTIIGVVGNTGAGKSSIINALLEEERIVPTNCMRACTAVVTEISYNNDKDYAYRAVIEFIDKEDWDKELSLLFDDIIESGDFDRESGRPDSEAGIAWAKLKAVYPRISKNDLKSGDTTQWFHEETVCRLFEQKVIEIKENDPLLFYDKLQKYVDTSSKEKLKKKPVAEMTAHEKEKRFDMEYWPLIKVVRLYLKSDVLKTGAVLVDLPGTHDSNAARAAIASKYMMTCHSTWVVAPIHRAVNDKSAKDLLGATFKRQLYMDGGYQAVSFICSKCDDISVTEAIRDLYLEDEAEPYNIELARLQGLRKALMKTVRDGKANIVNLMKEMVVLRKEYATYGKLKKKAKAGQIVYAPEPKAVAPPKKKQKGKKPSARGKKNGKLTSHFSKKATEADDEDYLESDIEDDDDAASDHEHAAAKDSSNVDDDVEMTTDADEVYTPTPRPKVSARSSKTKSTFFDDDDNEKPKNALSMEQIDAKLAELKVIIATKKSEATAIRKTINVREEDRKTTEKKIKDTKSSLEVFCIQERNKSSKDAIKRDFASGLREVDMHAADKADPENFDPTEDLRDYQEVEKNFPVFCVSSKAFQKLSGRFEQDANPCSFDNIWDTEIPKLQRHAVKATRVHRRTVSLQFLNELDRLLNSLGLWCSGNENAAIGNKEFDELTGFVAARIEELKQELGRKASEVAGALTLRADERLFSIFPDGAKAAASQADEIVKSLDTIVWNTYRAMCKRHGVHKNIHKETLNINESLSEPLIRHITVPWGTFFQTEIQQAFVVFDNIEVILTKAAEDIFPRLQVLGLGEYHKEMIKRQLSILAQAFKDKCAHVVAKIQARQKEINRMFEQVIRREMVQTYEEAAAFRGRGSWIQMRNTMHQRIDERKKVMFTQTISSVQAEIVNLIGLVQVKLEKYVARTINDIQSDLQAMGALPRADGLDTISNEDRPKVKASVEKILKSGHSLIKTASEEDNAGLESEYDEDGRPIGLADDGDDTEMGETEMGEAEDASEEEEEDSEADDDDVMNTSDIEMDESEDFADDEEFPTSEAEHGLDDIAMALGY